MSLMNKGGIIMKNKKILLIICVIIIIIIVAVGAYRYITSHTFPTQQNAKELMIKKVKGIENKAERTEIIDLLIQENFLTKKEANELY